MICRTLDQLAHRICTVASPMLLVVVVLLVVERLAGRRTCCAESGTGLSCAIRELEFELISLHNISIVFFLFIYSTLDSTRKHNVLYVL